jgi:hypothetical protein
MTQLGDAPIQEGLRDLMNNLAHNLDRVLNGDARGNDRKNGFVLMVFPFDEVKEGGRCNYISNAARADIVTMMKEQIKRFEGQPDMTGHA